MRRLAKPVSPFLGSEGSKPSLSASSRGGERRGMLQAVMERALSRARIAVALAALVSACAVHRELIILSDPPGAAVRLDQEIVGTTPYRTEFEAFGTRRVTLYKDGYRAWSDQVRLVAPWYATFPFDFFSEVLIPFGWHYRKKVSVSLEPEGGSVTQPDLEQVLERAEVLRKAGPEGPQRVQPPTLP